MTIKERRVDSVLENRCDINSVKGERTNMGWESYLKVTFVLIWFSNYLPEIKVKKVDYFPYYSIREIKKLIYLKS